MTRLRNYINKEETVKIGVQMRKLRHKALLTIRDISEMTGFAETLICDIENGRETGTSHLVEIAKAIGVHPMELFNFPIEVKPRFKKKPTMHYWRRVFMSITKMYEDTLFFNSPKTTRDVIEYLKDHYQFNANHSIVRDTLKSFTREGKLNHKTISRNKNWFVRKKNQTSNSKEI